MLIKVFDGDTPIPPGGANSVLRLRLVPRSGDAWRMFQQNFGFVARGRFETIGTGMTSISVRIAPDAFGAPNGLEATIVTINSTSIAQGTSYPLPAVDFLQVGTSTTPSVLHLVLGLGFPISKILVEQARAGIGYQVGDDLLKMPHRILAW